MVFRNRFAPGYNKAQLLHLISTSGGPPDPEALPAIERAANRLDTLFRQWLTSDRLSDESPHLEARPIPLGDLLRLVADEVAHRPSHALTFAVVPPGVRVQADPALLCTALLNLIDNAMKYSPNGGAIEVGVETGRDQVVVSVRDQGLGLAPQDRERVFEKYFRVTHDGRVRGFGLGLFLVRRIIGMHGGTVTVDSTLGAGSTFFVRLPLATAEMSELVAGNKAPQR